MFDIAAEELVFRTYWVGRRVQYKGGDGVNHGTVRAIKCSILSGQLMLGVIWDNTRANGGSYGLYAVSSITEIDNA